MILIVLKIPILPEKRDDWLEGIRRYSEAVRQEPSNPDFDCFESIETPNQFSIVESFPDRESSDTHVQYEHAQAFFKWFPSVLAGAPTIINTEVGGWSEMSELKK